MEKTGGSVSGPKVWKVILGTGFAISISTLDVKRALELVLFKIIINSDLLLILNARGLSFEQHLIQKFPSLMVVY